MESQSSHSEDPAMLCLLDVATRATSRRHILVVQICSYSKWGRQGWRQWKGSADQGRQSLDVKYTPVWYLEVSTGRKHFQTKGILDTKREHFDVVLDS